MPPSPAISVGPVSAPSWVADAVVAGGGEIVDVARAKGLVWASPTAAHELGDVLDANPNIEWVQLPWAGVERFVHLVDESRLWTCGKGVYAEPVAEHALSLLLAGMRNVADYARQHEWTGPVGRNLLGANVTILGGGGITTSLVRLLKPFNCHITVVRNMPEYFPGADTVMTSVNLVDALVGADAVIVALALTPDTDGMLSKGEFEHMERHAWLVNVGRGRHIVTDDLVWALREGVIGGAALDVTDPEPLPAGHPLWSMPNCIITPHVGNTPEMAVPLLSERISENVRRYAAGAELIGAIHPELGY
ncbi:MAG: D-isomer specific 2-hydroxyacid dehydrogenase family protein [Acidobacteria bacterium]|nr:D-isomer specific 2-hydroxyacid dehydrogenase family protein [Acidobacteriota bacterium]